MALDLDLQDVIKSTDYMNEWTQGLGKIETPMFTRLAEDAVSSATTAVVYPVPKWMTDSLGWVAIGVGTSSCEIRQFTTRYGSKLTIAALANAHIEGEHVLFLEQPIINVKWFGAVGDGSTDDSTAIQAAIDTTEESVEWRKLLFPLGVYRINTTLQVDTTGVWFIGQSDARHTAIGATGEGSTTLLFYGTGPLVQIGTDPAPDDYDAADYDGPEGHVFRDITLRYGGTTTALSNGQGSGYGNGTYAIRDWKGGDIKLDNVWIEQFQYGFWGIQSDLNYFDDVYVRYCKVGIYLGPRCGQFTGIHIYTLYNDTAVQLDAVNQSRFFGCQFVGDGTNTIYPIVIGTNYTAGTEGAVFDACWFEHYQGYSDNAIDAFVSIGKGDSVTSKDITFRDCRVLTRTSGQGPPRASYFATIEDCDRIWIENMSGTITGLDDLISAEGSTSPDVFYLDHYDFATGLGLTNNGTGSPTFLSLAWNAGDFFTVPWTDYSGTSTVTGWDTPTVYLRYKKLGKTVKVQFYITGTSDAATASFTLPYAQQSNFGLTTIARVQDDGTWAVGGMDMASGASTVTFGASVATANGSFTASGTKSVEGEFEYETA